MMDKITRAKYFAIEIHGSQKYDNWPYLKHLEDVFNVLVHFGIENVCYDLDLLACAFLHDAMEDGAASYNDIKEKFGKEVAEIVYAVTDELGRNRKERHKKTFPKIKENIRALILKLADRIANIEYSLKAKNSLIKMYRKEYPEFKKALSDASFISIDSIAHFEDVIVKMWEYLDSLVERESNGS